MITTRRADGNNVNVVENLSTNGNVALLERTNVQTSVIAEPTMEEARAKMQENLAKLLNYDRYSEIHSSVVVEEKPAVEIQMEISNEERYYADEDIRPSSTTMQFGDGSIEKFKMDMREQEQENTKYRLNGAGKMLVVLYALVVTVVLALIAINSGILTRLSGTVEAKAGELNAKVEAYNVLQQEIESISSSEYIIDVAESQYGMIKGN